MAAVFQVLLPSIPDAVENILGSEQHRVVAKVEVACVRQLPRHLTMPQICLKGPHASVNLKPCTSIDSLQLSTHLDTLCNILYG